MFWAFHQGNLELRSEGGATRLRGRFPYGRPAILSDGDKSGRPQKEVIGPRAFAYRVEKDDEDIHLLVGHSYDMPMASKATGTLRLRDDAAALTFEADITDQVAQTTHGRDTLALIAAGLAVGLSPGFRIPPERAVPNAVEVEDEADRPHEGMHRAIIRTVKAALLYELSIVVRPAYPEAQIEARSWRPSAPSVHVPPGRARVLDRWRL